MKTAILLGATGLTGGILLQKLLQDSRYRKVVIFSRRKVAVKHPKIEEHLVDLLQLENEKDFFKADEIFCCIGSTQKKTPDEKTYHQIDYGIPVTAAKIAKEKGIDNFLVISALGANAGSKLFYNRTKGEMERDVLAEGIPKTFIFQPALIAGDREEKRIFEKISKEVMKVANPLLSGGLKKYRSIHPETIAEAMLKVANSGYSKKLIPSDQIKLIASEGV